MQCAIPRLALAALAALALSATQPAGADGYTVTDLGTLPGKANSWVWQQTINNDGVVAAYANNIPDPNAFFGDDSYLWKDGTIIPLPGLPNAIDTVAFAINNQGQVVGRSTPAGERSHAVLWDHGVIYALPELPGDNKSAALMINDRGVVVGYSRQPVADGNQLRAVLWYRGMVFRLPSLPSGGGWEEALGTNEEGQIVGFAGPEPGLEHAVLWNKAGVHDLGTLGGPSSDAFSINNKGQVVGYSDTAFGGSDPFLWENGVMTDLGIPAGQVFGAALSINNRGQAVGLSGTDSNDVTTSHALLWENGLVTDLQTTIPASSGWTLLQALGINNRGQIIGFGIHNAGFHAFLLTPVK